MKNILSGFLVVSLSIFFVLGCGVSERIQKAVTGEDNKSVADKAIEEAADGETTGVQECDDLFKFFREQSATKDDNWVTKATKDYVIGLFKKQIKEAIEQNKNDKPKLAEQCKDIKKKFENRLKEEQQKK